MKEIETLHIRIKHAIKKEADETFSKLGLTTAKAVELFLIAVTNKNCFPLELLLPFTEDEDLEFATSIAMVDGVEPSKRSKELFKLYKAGIIDYETAVFAIKRLHAK